MSDRDEILQEFRSALASLWGIRDARVDTDASREITVRILGLPERTADETIRDVVLTGRSLGLAIDPSRVQVLRLNTEGPTGQPARRRIGSLSANRYDDEFSVQVTLDLYGDVLVGQSASPRGPRSELRATALATLEAARELLQFAVTIEAVSVFELGSIRTILVVLNRGLDALVGAAILRDDVHDAVARATLDGLNRFIARRPTFEPAQ
ncbi:MAG: hypothetical protein ACRDKB_02610 [Actinomycetota bacterium]